MKQNLLIFSIIAMFASCTSQEKLAYLNNLPEVNDEPFSMDIPEYKIQYRDILYITIKAMTPDGSINDFLSKVSVGSGSYSQSEASQYLFGYDVGSTGEIILPVIGTIKVAGKSLDEARTIIQEATKIHFNNATVECKLLSFKFTVIGEVRVPGNIR
jgi:polysaccharide biosynthesis/export protein